MRLPKKKALAAALALGVLAVLVTALPAFAAADTVSGFTPLCGVVGTSVTITGTGFTAGATATSVTFPGVVSQPVVPASDTSITTTVPATSTGSAALVVVDTDGNGTSGTPFLVVNPQVAPTIASFLPASGPSGTSVVITGGGFCGTTGSTGVLFHGTPAASYTVNSDTSITAVSPVGATTGSIQVTNTVNTAVSSTNFTPGAATTITSFAPTSGPVGTSVVITGTGLTGVTSVKFNGTTATFSANTATSVTAVVPAGATTGPIVVIDTAGTATSATSFTVTATVVVKHHRAVTLTLKKHLVASGIVHVADGFNACRSNVTVAIQRLVNGTWKTIGTDQTTASGKYMKVLNDKTGKYRAIAKKKVLNGGDDICMVDISAPKNH